MSNEFTPIVPPVTITLSRGLKTALEYVAARVPHGRTILDHGLREVVHTALDENPAIADATPVQIARRLGILKPAKRRRRA